MFRPFPRLGASTALFALAAALSLPAAGVAQTSPPSSDQTARDQTARQARASAPLPAFVSDEQRQQSSQYAQALRSTIKPTRQSAARALADARAVLNTPAGPRGAVPVFSEAAVLDATSHAAWQGLANALLAIEANPQAPREQGIFAGQAVSASIRALETARTKAEQAAALATLSAGLERQRLWRTAITALRESIEREDSPSRRATLERLVTEHGFRILEVKTDADAQTARACVHFSEPLELKGANATDFVRIDGREAPDVRAEEKALCVDGLEHGRRYQLQVRAGLASTVGESLQKSVELAIYVRDRSPSVRASGRAYVLPRTGQHGLPLTTVNASALKVEVYRIGDRALASTLQSDELSRQIERYEVEQIRERSGQQVYSGTLDIVGEVNKEVTTAFPVGHAIAQLQPGVYLLHAMVDRPGARESYDARLTASQWFIVTDLSLTAFNGRDGVHGFVRSLETALPRAGSRVRLIARNNEVLGEATTDASGHIRFDAGLARGEGGLRPAYLAAERDGDFAFLDLTAAPFDLTDRGVSGRAAPGPIDAFAFADRGVYRPGETVHITALTRDAEARPVKLPVTLVVSRPDGVEHSRQVLDDQGLGGRYLPLRLAASAMTGTWRLRLYADPKADPIATTAFLVEDFVPERLDMTVTAVTPALDLVTGGKLSLSGKYLYGPPAADLPVEADVVVKAASEAPEFPGYRFGIEAQKIVPERKSLEDLATTDASGQATFEVALPEIEQTQRLLAADVIVRLKELSGRSIERRVTLPVRTGMNRIGLKPLFGSADGLKAGQGDTVAFEAILVDGAMRQIAGQGISWELMRVENRWQWYNRGDWWSYDVRTVTERIANGVVDLKTDQPTRISHAVDWGRYRLELRKPGAKPTDPPAITSVEFTAGYWHDEAADSPEQLELAFDKPTYQAGDTARIRIANRVGGQAHITVLGSGLIAHTEASIPAGGGEITLPVTRDWGAGAYVAATLYRPLSQAERRMPGRAIGIKWLPVDREARQLAIRLDVPDQLKPAQTIEVPVHVAGLAAGSEARVVVAATDAGILNLTRYETPKPADWFFGQRKLGHELRDFYSRLIDGMRAERGRLRSGGDGGADETVSMSGAPQTAHLLALHSGIVAVGSDGIARVKFELPDFNGTVRLTAVAWSDDKVGSSAKDVIVRDSMALTLTTPRFLTLGDKARLHLDLHNIDGPAGTYKLAVREAHAARPGQQPTSLRETAMELKQGQRRVETVEIDAGAVGTATYEIAIEGPGGLVIERTAEFDVKPPASMVRRSTVASLAQNGGRFVIGPDVLTDLVPQTVRATVSVGPLAKFDVPGLLAALDRYPYGCAEQITSRALPLLYANDVANLIGLGTDAELRDRISTTLARLNDMQDASGAFGVWGPSHGETWLTSYVTDFMVRARQLGHTVDAKVVNLALDHLANSVTISQDLEGGGENRAYALYVLARAGRAPMSELRYEIEGRLERFATPLALAQLGAAAHLVGDTLRAERAFEAAIAKLRMTTDQAALGTRQDFGSRLRDGAAVLTLASESRSPSAANLQDVIAAAYRAQAFTSTQEQAWMLLAARSLAEEARDLRIAVNGEEQRGRLVRSFSAATLKNGALTIENLGGAATDVVVSVIGSALTPEPAVEKGFKIERKAFTIEGQPVDLASLGGGTATVRQNDRFVMVTTITADEAGGRILLDDPLPAGFEIDNPRLVESGQLSAIAGIESGGRQPRHSEFRDDRVVAAFDFFAERDGGQPAARTATVAYVVRAITPGTYLHPAAAVEDMYRPYRHARTAAGRLTVKAQ